MNVKRQGLRLEQRQGIRQQDRQSHVAQAECISRSYTRQRDIRRISPPNASGVRSVVCDIDHRDAKVLGNRRQFLPQPRPQVRIKTRQRLIEEQEIWSRQPTRVPARRAAARLRIGALGIRWRDRSCRRWRAFHRFVSCGCWLATGATPARTTDSRRPSCAARGARSWNTNPMFLRAGGIRSATGGRGKLTVQPDFTLIGNFQSSDQSQRGCLAAAARTENTQRAPAQNFDRQRAYDISRSKPLGDALSSSLRWSPSRAPVHAQGAQSRREAKASPQSGRVQAWQHRSSGNSQSTCTRGQPNLLPQVVTQESRARRRRTSE